MRKVLSSSEEVAKVWAARSQEEGRTGNGNFFFQNDVAYSYRWSFPVAAMLDAPDGQTFCLVETEAPSTSTAAVRSLAAGAAKEAGCTMIHLPSISPIVEAISRPKRKVGARTLNAIRSSIEQKVTELSKLTDRSTDNSWAQSNRLSTIAELLRAHDSIAASFGLKWPSLASAEAYEARAEMAYEVSRKAGQDKHREIERARKAAERRRTWEKNHPLPPAQELALWRTGERQALLHQPGLGQQAYRSVRARIVNGRFSTDLGWSRPVKEFSKLFMAAVASAAELPDAPQSVRFDGYNMAIAGNGDIMVNRWAVLHFDELMTCAEIGAPRLHAKAMAIIAEAANEDEAVPAGMAP